MNVPSLQTITLFALVKYKWKDSKLQALTIQAAYKSKKYGKDASKTDDVHKKIEKIFDDISDQIMEYQLLPHNLKVQWACALAGLGAEINRFAVEIVTHLKKANLRHAKFCIQNIIMTQEGYIDRVQTLLKIIKSSKFLIPINKHFLIANFISEEMLKNISVDILNEVEELKRTRISMVSCNIYQKAIDRMLSNYEDFFNDTTSSELRDPDALVNYACNGNILGIRYYHTVLKPIRKEGELLATARYVLPRTANFFDAEILMFFYQNLNNDEWKQLVLEYSALIINCLLSSWRYRHCCINVYRLVTEHYNSEMFKELLKQNNWNWEYGKYDTHNICQILLRVWFLTPDHIQKDVIVSDELAALIVIRMDYELLQILWENFSPDIQKHVIAKIIIILFNKNKETLIKKFLETISYPGITVDNYRDMLPEDMLREQLLHIDFDKRLPYYFRKPASFLKFFVEYFVKDQNKIQQLKQNLLRGTECFENWLSSYWNHIQLKTFLMWCHNDDENEYKKYLQDSSKDGRLQNAVEASIFKSNLLLDEILLDTLMLPLGDRNLVEQMVLTRPRVRLYLHNKCLNMGFMYLYDHNFVIKLFVPDDKQMYRDFMLSEDGIDSLVTLLCSVTGPEGIPQFDESFIDTLDFYRHLKTIFAYYGLVSQVDDMLKEYGHPNTKNAKIYVRRLTKGVCYSFCQARPALVAPGRRLVDIRFRCLRALLNIHPDTSYDTYKLTPEECRDLTTYSLKLAMLAGIEVPIVV